MAAGAFSRTAEGLVSDILAAAVSSVSFMHTTSVYSNRDVADTLSAVERTLIAEGQVTDELDCPMTGDTLNKQDQTGRISRVAVTSCSEEQESLDSKDDMHTYRSVRMENIATVQKCLIRWMTSLDLKLKIPHPKVWRKEYSDGIRFAEILHKYYPSLVKSHFFNAASGRKGKEENWTLLARLIQKKLNTNFDTSELKCILDITTGKEIGNRAATNLLVILYDILRKRGVVPDLVAWDEQGEHLKAHLILALKITNRRHKDSNSGAMIAMPHGRIAEQRLFTDHMTKGEMQKEISSMVVGELGISNGVSKKVNHMPTNNHKPLSTGRHLGNDFAHDSKKRKSTIASKRNEEENSRPSIPRKGVVSQETNSGILVKKSESNEKSTIQDSNEDVQQDSIVFAAVAKRKDDIIMGYDSYKQPSHVPCEKLQSQVFGDKKYEPFKDRSPVSDEKTWIFENKQQPENRQRKIEKKQLNTQRLPCWKRQRGLHQHLHAHPRKHTHRYRNPRSHLHLGKHVQHHQRANNQQENVREKSGDVVKVFRPFPPETYARASRQRKSTARHVHEIYALSLPQYTQPRPERTEADDSICYLASAAAQNTVLESEDNFSIKSFTRNNFEGVSSIASTEDSSHLDAEVFFADVDSSVGLLPEDDPSSLSLIPDNDENIVSVSKASGEVIPDSLGFFRASSGDSWEQITAPSSGSSSLSMTSRPRILVDYRY